MATTSAHSAHTHREIVLWNGKKTKRHQAYNFIPWFLSWIQFTEMHILVLTIKYESLTWSMTCHIKIHVNTVVFTGVFLYSFLISIDRFLTHSKKKRNMYTQRRSFQSHKRLLLDAKCSSFIPAKNFSVTLRFIYVVLTTTNASKW